MSMPGSRYEVNLKMPAPQSSGTPQVFSCPAIGHPMCTGATWQIRGGDDRLLGPFPEPKRLPITNKIAGIQPKIIQSQSGGAGARAASDASETPVRAAPERRLIRIFHAGKSGACRFIRSVVVPTCGWSTPIEVYLCVLYAAELAGRPY